eukprot:1182555-Prymnesium_polylepis.2
MRRAEVGPEALNAGVLLVEVKRVGDVLILADHERHSLRLVPQSALCIVINRGEEFGALLWLHAHLHVEAVQQLGLAAAQPVVHGDADADRDARGRERSHGRHLR